MSPVTFALIQLEFLLAQNQSPQRSAERLHAGNQRPHKSGIGPSSLELVKRGGHLAHHVVHALTAGVEEGGEREFMTRLWFSKVTRMKKTMFVLTRIARRPEIWKWLLAQAGLRFKGYFLSGYPLGQGQASGGGARPRDSSPCKFAIQMPGTRQQRNFRNGEAQEGKT
ncbi:hypothetical protein B0H14DRAFT_2578198 [Mycena olivaceomarginata]|nr:hypothetical protein B0H14DRAFT_2578198 [Mycena olivaceomarginata]